MYQVSWAIKLNSYLYLFSHHRDIDFLAFIGLKNKWSLWLLVFNNPFIILLGIDVFSVDWVNFFQTIYRTIICLGVHNHPTLYIVILIHILYILYLTILTHSSVPCVTSIFLTQVIYCLYDFMYIPKICMPFLDISDVLFYDSDTAYYSHSIKIY